MKTVILKRGFYENNHLVSDYHFSLTEVSVSDVWATKAGVNVFGGGK